MIQKIFRLLAIMAISNSALFAQTFEIRTQNAGGGIIALELRATSTDLVPTTTNDLTDFTFIIKWPTSYNVDLGAINNTGGFNIIRSGVRSVSGSFHYQSFTANGLAIKFPSNWVLNTWVEVMRIPNTLDGTGTGTFEIAEADFGESLGIADLNLGIDLDDYTPSITGAAMNVALPVQLTHFQAAPKQADVQLSWQTAAEQNFSHYDIERSADERSWASIAKVIGRGDTHTTMDYRHTDADALHKATGTHLYYRLKMVDTDGTYEYSPIRSVRVPDAGRVVRVQPNPTSDLLHITLTGVADTESITAHLYDAAGRQVLQTTYQAATPLNVSALPSGVYTLQLVGTGGILATERVVVE